MSPLIPASLMDSLGFLFEQTVTIQQRATGQDAYGQPVETWQDVTGMKNLPCVIFPSGGQEVKRENLTYTVSTHKIQLQHAKPSITPAMRAVSGGVTYDILLVETDPMGLSSKIICEVVR